MTWWNTGQPLHKVLSGYGSEGALRTDWRAITFALTAFTLQFLQTQCSSFSVLGLEPAIMHGEHSLMFPRLAPNCYILLCHSFTFYLIKVDDGGSSPYRQGWSRDSKMQSQSLYSKCEHKCSSAYFIHIYNHLNCTRTTGAIHICRIRK